MQKTCGPEEERPPVRRLLPRSQGTCRSKCESIQSQFIKNVTAEAARQLFVTENAMKSRNGQGAGGFLLVLPSRGKESHPQHRHHNFIRAWLTYLASGLPAMELAAYGLKAANDATPVLLRLGDFDSLRRQATQRAVELKLILQVERRRELRGLGLGHLRCASSASLPAGEGGAFRAPVPFAAD